MSKRGKKRRIRVKREALTHFSAMLPRGKRQRRRVEFLSGVALAVFMLLSAGVFFASSLVQIALRSPNVAAVVSAVLVELANTDRARNDLGSLAVNPVLVAAAQAKANDMASKGYFAHTSPEGLDPWFWFTEVGYSFTYAGENLAVDFSDSGDVNTAWMNSPSHRENILDPHFTEIGIATAQGMYRGRLTTFVVQEFGAPARALRQEIVAASTVPKNPTEVAIATTRKSAPAEPAANVLGTSANETTAATAAPHTISTTSPLLAASLSKEQGDIPAWGYLIGFPRAFAHYAYYLIGLLVILALLLDTGFEIKRHHRARAMRAGLALAVTCLFFALADYLFFAQPVLASLAASL